MIVTPVKTCTRKTFTKKFLRTQNCRHDFIKILLTKKRKENM